MALLASQEPAAAPPVSQDKLQRVDFRQLNTALQRLQTQPGGVSPTLAGYAPGTNTSFQQQAANNNANPLEHFGATLLSEFSRPQQAVLHAVEGRNQGIGGIIHGLMAGLAGSNNGPVWAPNNTISAAQALFAPQYQQKFGGTLQNAEGQTADLSQPQQPTGLGKLIASGLSGLGVGNATAQSIGGLASPTGAANLALETVADPLTYVTGGESAVARVGLKVLADGAGKDVAEQVATKGLRGLTDEQRTQAADVLRNSQQAANASPTLTQRITGQGGLAGNEAFTQNVMNALHQPQGLKFAGQTILPSATAAAAARTVGITPLVDAVKAVPLVKSANENFIQPFVRNRYIKAASGQPAAEDFGQARSAAGANAAIKSSDMERKFNRLTAAIPDYENFRGDLGHALETGQHEQLAQSLRDAGDENKAALVDAHHELRQQISAENIANGRITQAHLHDVNTYVPHTVTDEGKKWLDEHPTEAVDLGYKRDSGGYLHDTGVVTRKIAGTAKEANDFLENSIGKRLFEEDPTKAMTAYAAQSFKHSAKVDIVHSLTRIADKDGKPLLVPITDHAEALKGIQRQSRETVKDLNKKIASAERDAVRAKVLAAKTPLIEKARAQAAKEVERMRGLVQRSAESRFAATQKAVAERGTGKRLAQDAGLAAKRQRAEDLRLHRKEILSDPESSTAAKAFARDAYSIARKDYAEARRGVVAAVSGRRLNQGIGRAEGGATASRQLDKLMQSHLAYATRNSERAERAAYQHALRGHAGATAADRLTALKAQRAGTIMNARRGRAALKAQITQQPKGYRKVTFGAHGSFYGHPEAIRELDNLERKVTNPGAMHALGKALNSFNAGWKNLTLNAPLLAQGRVIRDQYSNTMQMWLHGFTDVTAFAPAARITKAIVLGEGKGLSRAEALATLSPADRRLAEIMDQHGVLEVGRVAADLQHAGLATTRAERRKARRSASNVESVYTRWGSKASQASDLYSRSAMWIDHFRKTGDASEAAKATDKALFNYSDLTHAERTIKGVIPFYTWFARNNALQAWVLKNVPQKSAFIARAQNDLANGQASGNKILPNYALNQGLTPLANIAGVPILGGLQTPGGATMQTSVQPLVDMLSQILPQKYTTQAGAAGGLASAQSNLGGAIPNTIRAIAEDIAGKNLATGAPLDKGKYVDLLHVLQSNVPRASSYESLLPNLIGIDKINALKQSIGITPADLPKGAAVPGTETDALRAAQLLRLLGVSAVPVTAQKQNSELKRRIDAVSKSADQQGIATATALKKAGKLRRAATKK